MRHSSKNLSAQFWRKGSLSAGKTQHRSLSSIFGLLVSEDNEFRLKCLRQVSYYNYKTNDWDLHRIPAAILENNLNSDKIEYYSHSLITSTSVHWNSDSKNGNPIWVNFYEELILAWDIDRMKPFGSNGERSVGMSRKISTVCTSWQYCLNTFPIQGAECKLLKMSKNRRGISNCPITHSQKIPARRFVEKNIWTPRSFTFSIFNHWGFWWKEELKLELFCQVTFC